MTIGDFDAVLRSAQSGAEWAFTLLYDDLNPALVRYLSAQARSAGEDLAAETWMAAARGLPSFSGDERSFRAWLFTIARRRLIQHWRETGRRPVTTVPGEAMAGWVAPDDPEASGVAKVSAQEAATLIASLLPPDQADVVLLRVLAGLDVEEVARLLGKRPGTVRVLSHKALQRLAARFSAGALTQ